MRELGFESRHIDHGFRVALAPRWRRGLTLTMSDLPLPRNTKRNDVIATAIRNPRPWAMSSVKLPYVKFHVVVCISALYTRSIKIVSL